ncbi:hypothetical protein RMN57_20730 [Kitasatospora sp. CM 4170]|uniref:Secreted protein n=1 Tax=Kitasatospora aburaviensis TaxID=67265 RepID=A0ABW1F4P1_9ACTN|nr:hypothetical protein [Kitasatospora sp. CM 4170]WNM46951.1 hypothetical protein RMN57_20730 [Kitasatospora sp. CM 4170]
MSRTRARLAAAGAAVVLTVTGPIGAAAADTAPAPTGSAVVHESAAFLKEAALSGVVVIPLPAATPSYDSTTGFSTTFPVTGGDANFQGYYGNVELGGSLLFINVFTGKSALFKHLAFSADTFQITGVAADGAAPVALLDPAGMTDITRSGATQKVTSTDLKVDAEGAQALDGKLNTSFFKGGQSVGDFTLTFTSGS